MTLPEHFSEYHKGIYRRRGRFSMTRELIENLDEKGLRAVFQDVIIINSEIRWEPNSIHYMALSKHFDEISEGEVCPWYTIEAKQHANDDGKVFRITKKWKRIKGDPWYAR